MRYSGSLTLILSTIATLATLTSAAECDSPWGSSNCLDTDEVWSLAGDYCNTDKWNIYDEISMTNSLGYSGSIIRRGTFSSQEECQFVITDIINTCFGHQDGGSWTQGGLQVQYGWCNDDNPTFA
jgi:hypothetical protein